MVPHAVQAVYRIDLKEPPAAAADDADDVDEREQRRQIDAAPRLITVGLCLPHGYALLEPVDPSVDICSFAFSTPLIVQPSMHGLLMSQSPLYVHWFEYQMMERMNALAQAQVEQSDDE